MEFYVNPIIGFRIWNVDRASGHLSSPIVSDFLWEVGEPLIAVCAEHAYRIRYSGFNDKGGPPHDRCTCGIYAWKRLKNTEFSYGYNPNSVIGVAAFWGRMQLHESGFRSQYARPLAISDHCPGIGDRAPDWKVVLNRFKSNTSLPVLPVSDLKDYGETFGELCD